MGRLYIKICKECFFFKLKFGALQNPYYKCDSKASHWNYSSVKGKCHSGWARL